MMSAYNPNIMKTALSGLLLTVILLSGASANTSPGTEPEYYYTRVMYTGAGTPESGGPVPMRYPALRDFCNPQPTLTEF